MSHFSHIVLGINQGSEGHSWFAFLIVLRKTSNNKIQVLLHHLGNWKSHLINIFSILGFPPLTQVLAMCIVYTHVLARNKWEMKDGLWCNRHIRFPWRKRGKKWGRRGSKNNSIQETVPRGPALVEIKYISQHAQWFYESCLTDTEQEAVLQSNDCRLRKIWIRSRLPHLLANQLSYFILFARDKNGMNDTCWPGFLWGWNKIMLESSTL